MSTYRLNRSEFKTLHLCDPETGEPLPEITVYRIIDSETSEKCGWAESYNNLKARDSNCCGIFDEAIVAGNAVISDNAQILGNTLIYGNVRVSNNADIRDNAILIATKGQIIVDSSAVVHENAKIIASEKDNAIYITDDAFVGGNAILVDQCTIGDGAEISGKTVIGGNTCVVDDPQDFENLILESGIYFLRGEDDTPETTVQTKDDIIRKNWLDRTVEHVDETQIPNFNDICVLDKITYYFYKTPFLEWVNPDWKLLSPEQEIDSDDRELL